MEDLYSPRIHEFIVLRWMGKTSTILFLLEKRDFLVASSKRILVSFERSESAWILLPFEISHSFSFDWQIKRLSHAHEDEK